MKKINLFSLVLAGLFAVSCASDDPPLPENAVNFQASELGFEEAESSKTITLNLDRAAETDITVNVELTPLSIEYGEGFTTIPAANGNAIAATIKTGASSATIEVKKEAAFFDGNETIQFEIKSASGDIVPGDKKTLKLAFGTIISAGSALTLQGGEGGSNAANAVFVDFSGNEQTPVARGSWNLGLYCNGEFAVKLNNMTASKAIAKDIPMDKAISRTDSAAYAAALAIDIFNPKPEYFDLADDLSGDPAKTVIKENKVYLVTDPGNDGQPLYRVKVTRKDGNTYTVQYARSDESAVKSIDVAKDAAYHFVYVSFAAGKTVAVEPQKAKWDIVWGRFDSKTAYQSGESIPYVYSDLVLLNTLAGVAAAEVVSPDEGASKQAYASFNRAGADALDYSTDIDAIGSKWRLGGGPGASPVEKADRFYVVKDASGNIYKLKFVSIGTPRGYPKIEYALVK